MAFLSFIKISSRQLILVRPALSCNVQYATFTSESSNVFPSAEPSGNESTVTPIFRVAERHIGRPALKDVHGLHTYGEVLTKSLKLAQKIRKKLGENRTQERIAFLCPNDVTYLIAQWACWAAGHIAVPLSPLHPPSILSHYLEDSQTSLTITCDTLAEVLSSVTSGLNPKIPVLSLDQSWREVTKVSESDPENSEDEEIKCDSVRIESANHVSPELAALISETSMPESFFNNADAMILYTSGTTGKPKGVVLSHSNIESQVKSLIQAWAWSPADVILHTLPLHHTHGIVNALLCPLYVGARCIMMPKFDAGTVWSNLLGVNMSMCERPTIYMAVPTIYSKLIDEHEKKFGKNPRMSEYAKATCASKVRLMVSGSAPLPEPVFHKWHAITGHYLLERYGMTEIGMALSNPLEGERRPGHVGTPLPAVRVRLAEFKSSPLGSKGLYDIICEGNSKATRVSPGQASKSGELLVTGPSVFQRYWNKPEATDKEFTRDGWFRTGDIAVYDKGYYKILGRASADIIKSGGYKISALEIETQLLSHPAISDCTVVGIPDPTWGQKVAAVVVVSSTTTENLPLDELKSWCRERMTPYSVPSEWKLVKSLPRNAMGKVNKKELVKEIFPTSP